MFDSWPHISIKCDAVGCSKERCWTLHNRKTRARVDYCDDHVPPLKTPRMSDYDYSGAIKFYSPVVDPVFGDHVVTSIGGRRAYGVVVGFELTRGEQIRLAPSKSQWPSVTGITVQWQNWKEESLPTHCLRKISALEALAMCADNDDPRRQHHNW